MAKKQDMVRAAQQSPFELFINNQSRFAPVRAKFRLVRLDANVMPGQPGTTIHELDAGQDTREMARGFEQAVISDLQAQSGTVKYKLLALSNSDSQLGEYETKAQGTLPSNDVVGPGGINAALCVLLHRSQEQTGTQQSQLFNQVMKIVKRQDKHIKRLTKENRAVWEATASQAVEMARSEVPSPVEEAEALVYESLAQAIGVAPNLIVKFLDTFAGDKKVKNASGAEVNGLKEAAKKLSDESIMHCVGVLIQNPGIAKAMVDGLKADEKKAFEEVVKSIMS